MALFDGINQLTKQVNVNFRDQRFFYYMVTQGRPVKLFLTSSSQAVHFFIAATLVSSDAFTRRTDEELYPLYLTREERNQSQPRLNYHHAELGLTGTSVLTIGTEDIHAVKQKNSSCYLLVSIFSDATAEQKEANS